MCEQFDRGIQRLLGGGETELDDLSCKMPFCDRDADRVVQLRANVGAVPACGECVDEYLEYGDPSDVRDLRTEDRMGVTDLVA